jgi:hypothetical protein
MFHLPHSMPLNAEQCLLMDNLSTTLSRWTTCQQRSADGQPVNNAQQMDNLSTTLSRWTTCQQRSADGPDDASIMQAGYNAKALPAGQAGGAAAAAAGKLQQGNIMLNPLLYRLCT